MGSASVQASIKAVPWLDTSVNRNRVLFSVAAGHLMLFLLMLIVAPFDPRTVTGINPWIKPMKFALSIAVYTATMAWLLEHFPGNQQAKRWVTRGIVFAMLVEMALITLQAARGVPSHFNNTSPFNAAVFAVMGLVILGNTALAAFVTLQFYRTRPPLSAAYLWGIRLGLTLFVLASLEGFAMVGRMSHAVGVADGGPGLPFVNWSTEGGDLRVAHFIGLHALQVVPLAGYLLSRLNWVGRRIWPLIWLWVFAMAYAVVSMSLFVQALAGRPLLRVW